MTPGYYTSFGDCEKCPEECETCADPLTCLSCKSGYDLDGESCLKNRKNFCLYKTIIFK